MTEATHILWGDLETTGSETNSKVLEFGFVLTDTEFRVINAWDGLIYTPVDVLFKMPPVVKEMHEQSGLWAELADPTVRKYPNTPNADFMIADDLDEFIEKFRTATEVEPVIKFAGSRVSHFDYYFMRKWFQFVWKIMDGFPDSGMPNKPTLDIGVVRRFIKTFAPDKDLLTVFEHEVNEEFIKELKPYNFPARPHRAMYDTLVAITQAKTLAALMKQGAVARRFDPWEIKDEERRSKGT